MQTRQQQLNSTSAGADLLQAPVVAGGIAEVKRSASALGKRAKIVSTSTRPNAGETAWEAGRRTSVLLEKDQPQHVRERVARMRRFQMQDAAARLAGYRMARDNRRRQDRVADCLRRISDVAHAVEVRYDPAAHSSYYRGLQTCGSVWHCPVCAAKISERRRDELAALVEAHVAAGGSVWMTTYTVSHRKYTDLADLVANFLAARRKMRQGRRGMRLREDFQIVGTVSVLEVTWSARNGWHPHVHELVFSADKNLDPGAYDGAARSAWKDAAAVHGLKMNTHGFKIDRTFGAVQDYITKFGHQPVAERPWGVENEVVKGHLKQARSEDGLTPFGLLAAVADGLEQYAPLWQEYARVFKGRKQLNYSAGLKALYQVAEQTDEELASQGETNEAVTLLELSAASWDLVVEHKARGGLLEMARSGRPGELLAVLDSLGIEAALPDMIGWRVSSPAGAGEVVHLGADYDGERRVWLQLDQPGPDSRLDAMFLLGQIEVLSNAARFVPCELDNGSAP